MEPTINKVNSPFANGQTDEIDVNRREALRRDAASAFGAGGVDSGVDSDRESWRDMSQRFYTDILHLFEREGDLIRSEMEEKITQVKAATVSFAGSGVVLLVGFICLAATAIIALDTVMSLWASALIVSLVFLAIGGIMMMLGKKKLEANSLKPTRSIEAFGEITSTLKEKMHEITKH